MIQWHNVYIRILTIIKCDSSYNIYKYVDICNMEDIIGSICSFHRSNLACVQIRRSPAYPAGYDSVTNLSYWIWALPSSTAPSLGG